jgi:lipoprotein-anchoring transpeptidase ErfK/SrfK
MCLYSAQASSQNLPNALFRPTIEDVDPGIDHGNSYRNLPETYQKQAVFYRSQEPPGTIIVETSERHLYLIQSETGALRYGIGVGREGFTWQGLLKISRKAECAPETIGQAVSSGCFRLVNDDVVDLYERVPTGTRVVVRQH